MDVKKELAGKPYFDEQAWVVPMNFGDELRSAMQVPEPLYIHDVTLRDGEQTPGVAFTIDEKVAIGLELDRLGVGVIEAGLPMIEKDAEAMRRLKGQLAHATLGCLVRANTKDIDDAVAAGVELVVVEHSINRAACQHAYNLDQAGLIEKNVEACRYAAGKGLRVNWMGWDAFRQEADHIERVFKGVVEGADPERVTIADTFGMAHPLAVMNFFKRFRAWFPDKRLEFHCHNDYGMAVANAVGAVTGGANSVHTAVNGLGERAGNIALEDFALAAQVAMKLDFGLELERLVPLARLVEHVSRFPMAGNKPVVGRNLFNVDSGLIIHILSKCEEAGFPAVVMMPYMPQMVGRNDLRYVAGKGAGAAAVEVFLHRAGLSASDAQKKQIMEKLKAHSTLIKDFLSDEEFAALAKSVIHEL
ncbi:MAG: hypothetical protein JXR37_16355 [Kiritimatiellae bacterium]|nr:hypothetical protein [Kiritimatiellia bacterium]